MRSALLDALLKLSLLLLTPLHSFKTDRLVAYTLDVSTSYNGPRTSNYRGHLHDSRNFESK